MFLWSPFAQYILHKRAGFTLYMVPIIEIYNVKTAPHRLLVLPRDSTILVACVRIGRTSMQTLVGWA